MSTIKEEKERTMEGVLQQEHEQRAEEEKERTMEGVLQQEQEQRAEEEKERTMAGVTQQEEDKKPVFNDDSILLKVKAQDGGEVFFKIKRSTHLRILMDAYCDRQSVDFNTISFLFDGRRHGAEETPDELDMEDGDEIDAVQHQIGGGTMV